MIAVPPDIFFQFFNESDKCEACGEKRPPCQLRRNVKNTITFKRKSSKEIYHV